MQQDVEHVGVRFFDFVQQDHGIRPAANRLGEITAFLVSHVAGRCADQAGHGMFLHELGHIDAHHGLLGVEHELGQRLAQLCFAHAGRSHEKEGTDRAVRVGQACPRAPDRIGGRLYGFVLPDDAFVQGILHSQQLLALTLQHPRHRDARPARNHFGNFILCYPVSQQLEITLFTFFSVFQLLFQLGYLAILQLGHARQVLGAHCSFQFGAGALEFFLDVRGALYRGFFGLPDFFEIGKLAFHPGNFFLQFLPPLDRSIVSFFLQSLALNFLLDQPPLQAVQNFGLGVDFHADSRCRLVHQVDGLVRQLAFRNITV